MRGAPRLLAALLGAAAGAAGCSPPAPAQGPAAPVSAPAGGTPAAEAGGRGGEVRGTAAVAAARGVDGQVLDGHGQPVAGAFIEVRTLDGPARALPEIGVLSDAAGHFHWPLPPGRYALRARLQDQRSCEAAATAPGGPVVVLRLQAPPPGGCPAPR